MTKEKQTEKKQVWTITNGKGIIFIFILLFGIFYAGFFTGVQSVPKVSIGTDYTNLEVMETMFENYNTSHYYNKANYDLINTKLNILQEQYLEVPKTNTSCEVDLAVALNNNNWMQREYFRLENQLVELENK